MEEFIGKKIKVEFVQEVGWKRPTILTFDKKSYVVKEIASMWEEHTLVQSWWQRKHRVWYQVLLENGDRYEIYWDRGGRGKGKDWILVKRISDVEESSPPGENQLITSG